MKKLLLSAAVAAAVLMTAGCASNADRRNQQYQEAGQTMQSNIGVVNAEQQRLLDEEFAREKAAAAKAEAQAKAKARADRERAQANARIAAEKKARQAKLDAYADRERELQIQLRELDVKARAAQVDGIVASEGARAERARDKVELELEQLRAQIEATRAGR